MAYFLISDFQSGLDTRKTAFSAPAGSLRKCENAHITRGGEVEKRRAFTTYASLPPEGTAGLHIAGDQLYTFGAGPVPAGVPSSVKYQQLAPENTNIGITLRRILAASNFNGKVYVVAEFSNGAIDHYYDGERLVQWDAVSDEVSGNDALARVLADRLRTDFGLIAVPDGTVITVTGKAANEPFTLTSNTPGVFVTLPQAPTETLPQISRIDIQTGFSNSRVYELEIDGEPLRVEGRATGMGVTAYTLQDRVFSTSQSLLRFSGFTDPGETGNIPQPDPTRWDISGGIGAGFINLSTQDSGSENLTAVAAYQGELAVFSRQAVHIRSLAFDVAQMRQLQLLRNIGTSSPRTVVSYGESDVFFLSQSGIRSLRARDSSNVAASADVGTPIDDEVTAYLNQLPARDRTEAVGAVEPEDGRYALAVGERVYVYSQFPGSKISAWSTYSLGGRVSDMAATSQQFFVRIGDEVLLYGGVSNDQYDDSQVDVILPFADAGTPGTTKQLMSLDIGCEGEWDVFVRPDPTLPVYEEYVGRIEGSTYGLETTLSAIATSTHFGLRLKSVGDKPAKLSQVIMHYDSGDAS